MLLDYVTCYFMHPIPELSDLTCAFLYKNVSKKVQLSLPRVEQDLFVGISLLDFLHQKQQLPSFYLAIAKNSCWVTAK